MKELARSKDEWAAKFEEEKRQKDTALAIVKANKQNLDELDGNLKTKTLELAQVSENLSKSKKRCDLLSLALQRKDLAFQEKEGALLNALRENNSLKTSIAELVRKCEALELNQPQSTEVREFDGGATSDNDVVTIAGDVLYSSRMNELAAEYADRVYVYGFKTGAEYVKDTVQKQHQIELDLSKCPDYEPECRVPPLTETIPRHFPLVPRRDTVEPPKYPGDFIKQLTCLDDDSNGRSQESQEEESENEDSEEEDASQGDEELGQSE